MKENMYESSSGKRRGYSSWQEEYRAKLCSAEEAAALVKSNDRVGLGSGTGIPAGMSGALAKRAGELENVLIFQGYAMGLYDYMKPDNRESFHIETMFVGPMERVCMDWGVAHYVPMHLSDIPEVARKVDCNIISVVVTPPDENGYMNRSLFGAFVPRVECIENADIVVVEVNSNTPWLNSEDFKIHVSEVDHIIENDAPVFELPEIVITENEKKIAAWIAEMIKDGSTIQLGLGGLSNAIGHLLMDKKDLGMHTEVVTPSVRALVDAGVLNGSRKSFCPGAVVAAFAVGTRDFYDYLDMNEDYIFREMGWINDPDIIGENDNMISINNALMMDLTGQAASESIGTRQYSGTGGQVNFIQGTRRSRNGMSIIALNSTYMDKDWNLKSKIMPMLPQGTVVSTSRNDIEYVVTEYGVANLRLSSIRERVKSLIRISHPDFRDELRFEAKKIGWL